MNPPEEWTALDALVRASVQSATHRTLPERLIEARRIVEVGAAELAAERRSGEDMTRLEEHLTAMHAADRAGDVDAFVAADLAFHTTVLAAAGNGLIAALLDALANCSSPTGGGPPRSTPSGGTRSSTTQRSSKPSEAETLSTRAARCITTSSRPTTTCGHTC